MEYEKVIEKLNSLSKFGSVLGLDNIKSLLLKLSDPEDALKVVHIAGTNGKGSVSAFLESVCFEAGLKVGVYNSPAVFDYRETVRINKEYVDKAVYKDNALKVLSLCEGTNVTLFEAQTAIAINIFKEEGCDIAIVETGMGGSLDATNVFEKNCVSVITSIGLDHLKELGGTVSEIAKVKAGIAVLDCPVVIARQVEYPEVVSVISDEIKGIASKCVVTGEPVNIRLLDKTVFDYTDSLGNTYKDLTLSMLGDFQADNAAVSVEVCNVLNTLGFNISKDNIVCGLYKTLWKGRFQKLSSNPDFYLDGGHNPGAAKRLRKAIDIYKGDRKVVYIMGVLADKDYNEIINIMLKDAYYVITVTPHNKRGLDGMKLKECVEAVNKNVLYVKTYKESYDKALEICKECGNDRSMIFTFGSLSFLGEFVKETGVGGIYED